MHGTRSANYCAVKLQQDGFCLLLELAWEGSVTIRATCLVLFIFFYKYILACMAENYQPNPKLDTMISSVLLLLLRHARTTPLDSETGWTEELWSNRVQRKKHDF